MVAMAFSVLLLGCSNDDDPAGDEAVAAGGAQNEATQGVAPGAPTSESGPPNLADDSPPVTTASSGGQTVEMGVGSFCWTTLCVDKIGPITRGTLAISAAAEVVVAVPDSAPPLNSVSAVAFPALNPQELEGGETAWQPGFNASKMLNFELQDDEVRIDAALEPGTYVLNVGMFFEGRDVQYGVVLEVE
jgi:hypothetical protein